MLVCRRYQEEYEERQKEQERRRWDKERRARERTKKQIEREFRHETSLFLYRRLVLCTCREAYELKQSSWTSGFDSGISCEWPGFNPRGHR